MGLGSLCVNVKRAEVMNLYFHLTFLKTVQLVEKEGWLPWKEDFRVRRWQLTHAKFQKACSSLRG